MLRGGGDDLAWEFPIVASFKGTGSCKGGRDRPEKGTSKISRIVLDFFTKEENIEYLKKNVTSIDI